MACGSLNRNPKLLWTQTYLDMLIYTLIPWATRARIHEATGVWDRACTVTLACTRLYLVTLLWAR